jgi:hypothetical protein
MKKQPLIQFAASLFIALSLFVSSVSACACSSHGLQENELSHCQPQQSVKAEEQSAHQHSTNDQSASHHSDNSPENISASFSENECCCVQSAPKVSAKTENIKIEKQKATVSSPAEIKLISLSQIVTINTVGFVSRFYLSDSFRNLTPGRAPPRL